MSINVSQTRGGLQTKRSGTIKELRNDLQEIPAEQPANEPVGDKPEVVEKTTLKGEDAGKKTSEKDLADKPK